MRPAVWLSLCALAVPPTCRGEWRVWTETRTVHVLREDPAGGGRDVKLSAARNESRGFQVLVRSDAPEPGVRLEPADLQGPGGATLLAGDAELYRQHQFEIAVPSSRNDPFRPGWYPDALIPFRHPLTRQPLRMIEPKPRFVAVPFDLPANQTHGFWVELYVPADARPGEYHGTYRLTAASRASADIPVSLVVWDFSLPATLTMQTSFGDTATVVRRYYEAREKAGKGKALQDGDALERQVNQLLADHRFNATPPRTLPVAQPDDTYRVPDEQVRALRDFVDHYHVNAVPVPRPQSVFKDPERDRDKLRAWLHAWDDAAAALDRPGVIFYIYILDEPNTEEAYRTVQKWGKAVRDAKSVVKVMTTEQTRTQDPKWGDLYGAVDIWAALFPLYDPETAAQRQALGETMWVYTALTQRKPTPWWETDYPLLNYRCPAWIAWRYRIRGLLYWGGMAHWRGVEDPWTDPKTLDRRKDGKGQLYNGDGSLVYPARDAGYDGIVSSLRLKAIRDSIEDYEYLAILERAGKAAEARRIVQPLAESWFNWEKDPAAYDRARAKLAELILSARR